MMDQEDAVILALLAVIIVVLLVMGAYIAVRMR